MRQEAVETKTRTVSPLTLSLVNNNCFFVTGVQGEGAALGEATGSGDKDKDSLSADPVSGVEANRPMDFHVFINLVDFCRSACSL